MFKQPAFFQCPHFFRRLALRAETTVLSLGLFTLMILTGCTSPKVTDYVQPGPGKILRPNTIWVHDDSSNQAGSNSSNFGRPGAKTVLSIRWLTMGKHSVSLIGNQTRK